MKGQTLIELLLAIGLTAIILPAILTGLVASRSGKAQQNQRLEAVALLKEAQEAVRNVREKDWNTFAVNGTFHPEIAVDYSWSLVTNAETINGFTRQVVISDVNRDSSGAIVLTGGTLDPSTKKIVTTVSWNSPTPSSVTSTTYIARLDNITYTETLEAEFTAGTQNGVDVTNTSGGEIKLASAGGSGDWCNPATPSATLNLTGQSVAKSITAIEGRAFVGAGQNASGHALYNVTISNPPPPADPILEELGIYDDNGLKTNGVFGESHYAYLATDKNSTEVVILDVATSTPTFVGSIDTSGPTDANSVFWSDNYLYVTTGSTLYVYDVTDRANPDFKDSIPLAGTGNKIYVVNHIAYIAIGSTTTQLQIVNATDPENLISTTTPPMRIGVNDKPGQDVFVNPEGTRTYLVTSNSSGNSEFFIIDTEIKDSLSIKDDYETASMDPKGVTIPLGSGIAVIVGYGGEEYQVIRILNDEINYCGGIDTADNINGVSSVLEEDEDAWAYIITDNAGSEMQAIEGGPGAGGGGSYASSGDFESQTIPIPMPVNETSFNRFEVTVNRPSLTDIQFQVAVAKAILGSCSGVSFTFVGEDGTVSDFFETAVTSGQEKFDYSIPTAINPGQCFRYKAFLSTSDSSQTPIFYDITINYAP